MTPHRVFIGFDPDQMAACAVAARSVGMTTTESLEVRRVALSELIAQGLYTRETRYPSVQQPGYWDVISDAPMSTGHAIARFLVPHLCAFQGWALFTDGDVLFRSDVSELFALADPQYAVHVVKHQYAPLDPHKMDGQTQTRYFRKNWSSVMLFNCGHPANQALTVDLVNTRPGRDLHRFCWLEDEQIGSLPARWNLLVGHSAYDQQAAIVHFTAGVPNMPGYERVPYADEWHAMARTCGYRFTRPAQESVA